MAREPSDASVAKKIGITEEQVELLQRTRGFTNATLVKLPLAVLRTALRRLQYPNSAERRADFRHQQEQDETGGIPVQAPLKALRELDSMRVRAAALEAVAGVPCGKDVTPRGLIKPTAGMGGRSSNWEWLGPGNIGGRTRSIVIHPQRPDTIWIGSVGGGVWRTDDGGVDWDPVNDQMANLAVSCMVMDPTDSDRIYAGTGEGFSNIGAVRGAGLFFTTDGTQWQQLASTATAAFQWTNRLAISADGKVLLVATNRGILRSDDPHRTTWTRVLGASASDINFHPTDPKKVVAGGRTNGRAYFSRDGGSTWRAASLQPFDGRVELTYAVKNPDIVYASVDFNSGQIWRSSDGGKTYSRRATRTRFRRPARYLGDQGWYDNVIWAGNPDDSDLVIVGGIDLWKSTDGGDTLREISTWWDQRSAHADHHVIVAHPDFDGRTNKTVLFGNDGGIYKTDDVLKVGNNLSPPHVRGWIDLNNDYGVTQFYGGAGNVSSGTVIGGAQDNGTVRYTKTGGPQRWSEMFGGDGGFCAADPTNAKTLYGEYVYLNIHRSTDGGRTSEYISGQYWDGARRRWSWKPPPYQITDAANSSALFIAPFLLDPNKSSRLLGGALSLWRTNNARTRNTNTSGPRWAPIKPSTGSYISAICVAPGDSNLIWVGHRNGDVFKTVNGTRVRPTWMRSGAGQLPSRRYCGRIAVDPSRANTVYVAFAGYSASSASRGNVWKTRDGGNSWTNIGHALPDAPARALAIHPRRTGLVYVGTEVGLFASDDGGATWSPTNEGPTSCAVYDLFWMDEKLVCVTHGRGMFRIDLSHV